MKKKTSSVQDHIELGQFYILNNKYSEAIKQFTTALNLRPDAQVYFQLGIAYELSNQIPEAKEMYRKTIELDRTHKEAAEHLNHLTMDI